MALASQRFRIGHSCLESQINPLSKHKKCSAFETDTSISYVIRSVKEGTSNLILKYSNTLQHIFPAFSNVFYTFFWHLHSWFYTFSQIMPVAMQPPKKLEGSLSKIVVHFLPRSMAVLIDIVNFSYYYKQERWWEYGNNTNSNPCRCGYQAASYCAF